VEVNEIFEDWSKRLNVPVEEFRTEYDEWYSKLKKDRPELSEEQLKAKCLSYIRGVYSRQFQSTAKNFSCYIIGYGEGYDPYKKERERAKEIGAVDENGNPVFFDERPQLAWRKGRPIPKEEDDASFQRFLYGVFKLQGTDVWKPGIFYYTGRKLNENIPESFVEYKVRAGCKDGILQQREIFLNTAGVTRFIKVGDRKVDFEKMAIKILTENLVSIDKLDELDESSVPLQLFITKGIVVGINLTSPEVRSNSIDLALSEEDVTKAGKFDESGKTNKTFWVHKELPLDFGVGSEVIVIGQKYRKKDKDTGEMIPGYNAVGIYVKYNSAPEEKPLKITKENIVEEEEKEVEVKEKKEVEKEVKKEVERGEKKW